MDTESEAATPINIQGAEPLFADGHGLYVSGRTLYVMQTFQNKIAVVQLSGDLNEDAFVKNIVGDQFAIPTTITGYGNSLSVINTHFCEITVFCGIPNPADPTQFQTDVVNVPK